MLWMPQMKPLNWLMIMLFIIFNLYMVNSFLYSFYNLMNVTMKVNKKFFKNNWTWKW